MSESTLRHAGHDPGCRGSEQRVETYGYTAWMRLSVVCSADKFELKFCGTVRNSWQVFQGLGQHQTDREKDGQSPTILKGGKVMSVLPLSSRP